MLPFTKSSINYDDCKLSYTPFNEFPSPFAVSDWLAEPLDKIRQHVRPLRARGAKQFKPFLSKKQLHAKDSCIVRCVYLE